VGGTVKAMIESDLALEVSASSSTTMAVASHQSKAITDRATCW